ncbi:hypothetical protein [uncultured Endozoicomonas sp.]|uniref:hypothetical protein n=1 Tax=uncultured Endozoicomonas sp. TaxID=432652 RepID=UPI00262E0605|nr:hypothetical protein [uncultured Endozoicomonas sp.]
MIYYAKRKQFQYWYIPAATKTALDPDQNVVSCFSESPRKTRTSSKKKKYLIFKEITEFSTAIGEREIQAP